MTLTSGIQQSLQENSTHEIQKKKNLLIKMHTHILYPAVVPQQLPKDGGGVLAGL